MLNRCINLTLWIVLKFPEVLFVFLFIYSFQFPFISFWLCWGFIAVGFSLVAASGVTSLVEVCGLLRAVVSLICECSPKGVQTSVVASS